MCASELCVHHKDVCPVNLRGDIILVASIKRPSTTFYGKFKNIGINTNHTNIGNIYFTLLFRGYQQSVV